MNEPAQILKPSGNLTAYTLVETILGIAEAQRDGRVVVGQLGDIRFNSSDPLTPSDVAKLAREALHELQRIQVAYDILEAKAMPFHCKKNLSRDIFDARENMWAEVYNLTRFTKKSNHD